jgi:hypothetical protein
MNPFRSSFISVVMLGAAGVLAQAQAIVTPSRVTLLPGRTCAFRLSTVVKEPSAMAALPMEEWTWTILENGVGVMDEAAGVYTAPDVAEATLVNVLATHRFRPAHTAKATLLILPTRPFAVVAQVLGPRWMEPFSAEAPFMNLATRQRSLDAGGAEPWPRLERYKPIVLGGYGLPFTLRWEPHPGAQAQLLSFDMGGELVQMDVSGQSSQVITLTGRTQRYAVEALQKTSGLGNNPGWASHLQVGNLMVTGLTPFVGNAACEAGHEDGLGLSARFRAPFGLAAMVARGPDRLYQTACLVTDPHSHVLRWLARGGEVSTLWGQPGQSGHRDTEAMPLPPGFEGIAQPSRFHAEAGGHALFNRPTFLVAGEAWDQGWRGVVADSGNHCLRILHPDGRVGTLAGCPGQAGHRDVLPGGQAQFNNPQGLAEGSNREVYIADQGNFVLRRLSRHGEVRTLAGSPGEPGARDGVGAAARFTELRGLALSASGTKLYIADGNAIRCFDVATEEVTTPLGVVAASGFANVLAGAQADRLLALQRPCLHRPMGLSVSEGSLLIADQGNQSVRLWRLNEATLETLVGEPGPGAIRWGLLRSPSLDVPLDERFATLEQPCAVVTNARHGGPHYVSTGTCVAEFSLLGALGDRLGSIDLTCPAATLAEGCSLRFAVAATTPEGQPSSRPLFYSVDFCEADGTLAQRLEGTGMTANPITVRAMLAQRGTGTVIVRCVTDQGVSAGAQQTVEVL